MGTIIASPPGGILVIIASRIQLSSEPTIAVVGLVQLTTRMMVVELPLEFHSRLVLGGSSSTNPLATSKKSNLGFLVRVIQVAPVALVALVVWVRYVVGVDLVKHLVVIVIVVIVVDVLSKYRYLPIQMTISLLTIKLPTIVHFIVIMVP